MNAVTQAVQGKFNVLGRLLDERTRRLWAAAEARAIGRGGITRVAEATGLSRGTVRAGVRELDSATSRHRTCTRAQVPWLRDRLLKLGVQVVRSVRRIVLRLPRATPDIATWRQIAFALGARAG